MSMQWCLPQYQLRTDAHDCYLYFHKKGRCSYVVRDTHLPRNWKYLPCLRYLITASQSKTRRLFSLISFSSPTSSIPSRRRNPSPAPPLQDPPVQHHNQRPILATPLVNTPRSGTLAQGSPLASRPFSSRSKTTLAMHSLSPRGCPFANTVRQTASRQHLAQGNVTMDTVALGARWWRTRSHPHAYFFFFFFCPGHLASPMLGLTLIRP